MTEATGLWQGATFSVALRHDFPPKFDVEQRQQLLTAFMRSAHVCHRMSNESHIVAPSTTDTHPPTPLPLIDPRALFVWISHARPHLQTLSGEP